VSRLSRLALGKRSVTLLFAGALFSPSSAWAAWQELLPDIDFPVTVVTRTRGRLIGRDRAGDEADRERHRGGAAPRDHPLTSSNSISLVTQFSHGTNVGDDRRDHRRDRQGELAQTATPTIHALNINASPVVILDRRHRQRRS
jgi:hypothetical protein